MLEGKALCEETQMLQSLQEDMYVQQYQQIDAFRAQMENFRIAPEELEQTKAMVDAAHSLYQDRIHGKGDAQHATQQRNKKRRELRQWMAQFKKAARLALHDEPQLMEVLGVTVRSQRV